MLQGYSNKTGWNCHKTDMVTNGINGVEDPEIKPVNILSLKKKSEIHTGIKTESSRNDAGQIGWLYTEESK